MLFELEEKENTKVRKDTRELILRPIEGKKAISSTGLIDTRLFDGKNKLLAILDKQTCLWYMRYEQGGLPNPLKQKFTSFEKLHQYASEYFKKRNVEIVEVID